MAELKELVKLLQDQMEQQKRESLAREQAMQAREQAMQQQMELQRAQMEQQREQMVALVNSISGTRVGNTASIPNFTPFDSTAELWKDYWDRFNTFIGANSIPEEKRAQVFLTNQTPVTYKLLCSLASQQTPPRDINQLTIGEIEGFMKAQFDPTHYIVRERYKFWSDMKRKLGETIQELAARIRQDAVTCDFASIKDPLDEALRTRFICSVGNEAVLKALFKVKEDELTFAKAISIAIETEDAAKVAKETVYGTNFKGVHKVTSQTSHQDQRARGKGSNTNQGTQGQKGQCYRCGKSSTDFSSGISISGFNLVEFTAI